jgi:hypothetical protein
MKSISVSTDVYAKIWSLRVVDEDSEDAVLRRVLKCPVPNSELPSTGTGVGFFDSRYNVQFKEGFMIFRTYKRLSFQATAKGGRWHLLNDGKSYESLNRLSKAIGVKTENAWVNWNYADENGERIKISTLRKEDHIDKPNSTSIISVPKTGIQNELGRTWRDDIEHALENLGGQRASLKSLYKEVEKLRRAAGRSLPPSLEATVRERLEMHSSDSEKYMGGPDLFCMPEGKGSGIWGLRKRSV